MMCPAAPRQPASSRSLAKLESRSISCGRACMRTREAVLPDAERIHQLLSQAKMHPLTCICLFTRKPEFFSQLGFAMAHREDLPDKIYKDCCVCPRFHCCDEVAMVRGELPKFAILPEPTDWLVKLQA